MRHAVSCERCSSDKSEQSETRIERATRCQRDPMTESEAKPDDYINVTIELDDMDITSAETKATYDEIKRGADTMPSILVVEDDENLNRGITFSLKKSGYEVFSAESVKKAKRIASDNNVDVTICDVNLPDGNGLEFVRWMRCNYNTYIICLTALDQEMDQVMGYEAGADDYITKPFSLSVLLLKIEAHFRRRQEKTEAGKMISGDIVFIAGEMKVLIKSREISLTKTELKMLTFFLQNPKQILSKTQILENVFDLEGDFVDENTIAVNIRRLREKIEDNPAAPVYIKNIRGLGYIWNQEVRQ